jgi:hypothetical protein
MGEIKLARNLMRLTIATAAAEVTIMKELTLSASQHTTSHLLAMDSKQLLHSEHN